MSPNASQTNLTTGLHLTTVARSATDFAAYLMIVSAAVAITVVVLLSSVSGAVRWLDAMGRPNASAQSIQPMPVQSQPTLSTRGKYQTASFAMLPSAMPVEMRDEVISSNF